MDILTLIWLNGLVAVVLLFFILYTLRKKTTTPDNDEAIRQEISDKLDKAISDIKTTV